MSHYRSALSTPQGTSDPNIIKTELQALDLIGNGGRVILLGDIHNSHDGPKALTELMPTLARTHVTALAAELPPSMNNFISNLQNDVRTQNLSPQDVSKILKQKWESEGRFMTAGDQGFQNIAEVVVAASKQNIKIVGIDGRQEGSAFTSKLYGALSSAAQPDKINDILYSMDGQNAQRAVTLLESQGDQNRIAIMHGAWHSCEGEKQPRLAEFLKKQGISVTTIALDQKGMVPSEACTHPVSTGVDADAVGKDISGRQRASNQSSSQTPRVGGSGSPPMHP